MAWIVAGVLGQIDRARRRITIGGQTYELLPAIGALDPELAPGMSVIAVVVDSDGVRRVAGLKPNRPSRFTAPR